MPHVPPFPQEGKASPQSDHGEKQPQFKRPEFILIDERNGNSLYTHFRPETSQTVQDSPHQSKEQSSKGPISLRFVCLLGFIFCLVFGVGMVVLSFVLAVLTILSLFQNRQLIKQMAGFLKIAINTLVAGFGFTLGMISPTLGLGLLAIYFSLASNLVEDNLLRKIIRRSFTHL